MREIQLRVDPAIIYKIAQFRFGICFSPRNLFGDRDVDAVNYFRSDKSHFTRHY